MNRRDFLNWLGIGSTLLFVDPTTLISAPPVIDVRGEYPRLQFTGLKKSMTSTLMAGQFLWLVDYVDLDGNAGRTHWCCNIVVTLRDLRINDPRTFVQSKLRSGAMTVVSMMDGIVNDAMNGEVQNGTYKKIPNPDFNPNLPVTSPYDDEYEKWDPEFINGDPIKVRVKSMKFSPYEFGSVDAWDIDRLTDQVLLQLNRE